MKKLNKEGKITCWKIYKFNDSIKTLYPIYYNNKNDIKGPGIVISNRQNKKLINIEKEKEHVSVIYKGIHVYTTRAEALLSLKIGELNKYCVIIPVTCYKKDLIAQGTGNEAAFMNVTIEKDTWDKISS